MRKPRRALDGEIAGELNLLGERQHVRIKPRRQQYVGLNALGLAMHLRLVDDAGERGEHLDEEGDSCVVEGHEVLSPWINFSTLTIPSFRAIGQRSARSRWLLAMTSPHPR